MRSLPPQPLAGIGLTITLRQSRYTNLRAPGTKKGRHPSGYLHHFNHYHYRRDDDGQQDHHHPKKEPEECGGLLLFVGFVLDDDLRISQGVFVVDWLLLGLVGDCEAVVYS